MKKNKSKKDNCKVACAKKTSIGGQALLEGIMMRGPKISAMAVRRPNGEMVIEKWDNPSSRPKIFKLPIIRGVFGFIDSMTVGYKALMRSAEISGLEELDAEIAREKQAKKAAKAAKKAEKSGKTVKAAEDTAASVTPPDEPDIKDSTDMAESSAEEKKKSGSALTSIVMVISSVLGVVLAVGLFILLPTFLYNLLPIPKFSSMALNSLIKSAFEGILKIAMLVGYMALVSRMKDIKRTFMYHGAEHKTIFCYESGEELTVENVRRQRRFHPRCGTAFLVLMLIVGMFVSFFIDPIFYLTIGTLPHVAVRAALKLLTLPLVMGIGYELIKLAGRHDNLFTRIISAPGLWLQRLTVLEPTDDMIECAITAFVEVIPKDQSDNY